MKRLLLVLLALLMVCVSVISGCAGETTTSTSATTATTSTTSGNTTTGATTAATTTTDGKVYKLRWAHFATAVLESSIPLTQMCDNIRERTNGRCDIQIFWSDSLIPMFELLDAVRLGSTEMATFPTGAFTSVEPIFCSAEIPFLYDSVEAQLEGQMQLVDLYNKVIEEKFSQKALSVTSIHPLNIGNSKHPIQTLEDWEGLMVQSISSITAELTTAFGATGAPASPIEVYELLQKGTVDATIQSLGKYVEVMLWEVCPYITNAIMVPASAMTTININVWNDLPADIQAIIIEEADIMAETTQGITLKTYNSYLETLEENMEVYNLPKAERDRWKEAAGPVIDSNLAKMGDFADELTSGAAIVNEKYPYPY